MDKKGNIGNNHEEVGSDSVKPAWWQPAVMMFVKLSTWIVFPVLLAVYVGKWLDKKYDSEPWLFLLSVGVAFIVSMVGLVINASKEYKKIQDEELSKDKKED